MNAPAPSSRQVDAARPVRATPPWVLHFEEVRARDLPRVGGKGANLGELAGAGFPVPPGFCVTTAAYSRFLEAFGESAWLWAQLEARESVR